MAINESSPLSPATFHVLLSLAARDLHGYGILLEVGRLSGNQYRIGPGTLYDNLKKLLNLGWVKDYKQEAHGEESRLVYHLTDAGRSVLAADVRRLKHVVRTAHRLLGDEGCKA